MENEWLGKMTNKEAQDLAEKAEMDLVLIAYRNDLPVCKIIDYGKYRYELQKKEKQRRKEQVHKVLEMKEVRLHLHSDKHDIVYRLEQVYKFLREGHRVRIVVNAPGRYRSEAVMDMIENVKGDVLQHGALEQDVSVRGRNASIIFKPINITLKVDKENIL